MLSLLLVCRLGSLGGFLLDLVGLVRAYGHASAEPQHRDQREDETPQQPLLATLLLARPPNLCSR